MIRFIAKAAVAAAAAGIMAAGMAAPALAAETAAPVAEAGYENHVKAFGGGYFLSNLCIGNLNGDVALSLDLSSAASLGLLATSDVDEVCDGSTDQEPMNYYD